MSLKSEVKQILENRDREAVIEKVLEDRRVVVHLNRQIFNTDPLMGWRAVEALGWVAREDPYLLENIIARLIYTMNDDSGSIGWMAPQALGELCAVDPDLVEDFFPIVLSSVEVDVFRAGSLWAAGRVAPIRPDLVEDFGPVARRYLGDPSSQVRGMAVWALGQMKCRDALAAVENLVTDQSAVTMYQDGRLLETSVGRLAEEAAAILSDI